MTSPDPDPSTTTGLEPGGGVPPGETPPGESAMAGLSTPQKPPGKGMSRVAVTAIVILVLCVIAFGVARVIDFL